MGAADLVAEEFSWGRGGVWSDVELVVGRAKREIDLELAASTGGGTEQNRGSGKKKEERKEEEEGGRSCALFV